MPKADELFKNRHVVVAGVGRSGQAGEVIAREFARCGASLILVNRGKEEADARAADLRKDGHDAHGFGCDLTSDEQLATLLQATESLTATNGIAALINVAGGYAASGNVAESSSDLWDRMFAINLVTAYKSTRTFLPALRKGKGAIVFFATGAALAARNVAKMSAYAAAKSGIIILTRAVAEEEKDNGVRANAIAPNAIRTEANLESMGEKVRYVEREEVARTVRFLCSPEASAINGEIIRLT